MNDDKVNRYEFAITLPDEDGKEKEYWTLFTFHLNETGHSYLVFTDDTEGDNDEADLYAVIVDVDEIDPLAKEINASPIESEEERALVDAFLDDVEDIFGDYTDDGYDRLHWGREVMSYGDYIDTYEEDED